MVLIECKIKFSVLFFKHLTVILNGVNNLQSPSSIQRGDSSVARSLRMTRHCSLGMTMTLSIVILKACCHSERSEESQNPEFHSTERFFGRALPQNDKTLLPQNDNSEMLLMTRNNISVFLSINTTSLCVLFFSLLPY